MEIAVDVAILDPATEIAVLRGGEVDHPKYRGKRIFGAGINLTHLYRGKIPFVWYMQRDLGYVHKMLPRRRPPRRPAGRRPRLGVEKPWIAAVDSFAIGGHCQALLVMDYVLAAAGAYMTLAGAQGRHHSRRRQSAPAALRRRPARPAAHPV